MRAPISTCFCGCGNVGVAGDLYGSADSEQHTAYTHSIMCAILARIHLAKPAEKGSSVSNKQIFQITPTRCTRFAFRVYCRLYLSFHLYYKYTSSVVNVQWTYMTA